MPWGLRGREMEDTSSARGCLALAEQIHARVESTTSPETKQALLRLAESYELMAVRISKGQIPN